MKPIAYVMLFGSAVAFAFLAYTLVNLDGLGIGPFHPRVLVEAGLGVVFGVVGLLLMTR